MTPVPTAFLADHMLSAPSDYVKVYLYGLYLSSAADDSRGEQMESRLHMKSSDIDDALRYWERAGLLAMRADGTVTYQFGGAAPKEEPYPYVAFNMQVAEALGRDPSPSELRRAYEWLGTYDLPKEVVLELMRHCVGMKGSRVSFNYMEKVAADWAHKGVDSIEAAREEVETYKRVTGGARKLLKDMGIVDRLPDRTEMELYEKWTHDWGFPHEGICWAMRDKEFSTRRAPFKYLDTILSGFHERGMHAAQEIQAADKRNSAERDEVKQVLRKAGIADGVTAAQLDAYRAWRREGYTLPVILEAGAKAAESAPKDQRFEQIGAVLDSWKRKGTTSETDVMRAKQKELELTKAVQAVYDGAGITSVIRESDRRLYTYYTETRGMEPDVLHYAAVLSSIYQEPRKYFGAVLRQWANAGVKNVDDARRASELHEQAKFAAQAKSAPPTYAQRPVAASDAEQRAYRAVQDLEARYGHS